MDLHNEYDLYIRVFAYDISMRCLERRLIHTDHIDTAFLQST